MFFLSDDLLLNYKRCQRRGFLNIYGDGQKKDPASDFLLKLKQESQNHVQEVLAKFYPAYSQPNTLWPDWQSQCQETMDLMRQGVDCIYQGMIVTENSQEVILLGIPHLLIKQSGSSIFGPWQYFPITIRSAHRPKSEYKLIAAFYAHILADFQGAMPTVSQIITRSAKTYSVNLDAWLLKLSDILFEVENMLVNRVEPEVFISRQRCHLCRWYSDCHALAKSQNHLSLVPGVTPNRYQHLQSLGIVSLESLASVSTLTLGDFLDHDRALILKLQAFAILFHRIIFKSNSLDIIPSHSIELYFDIEAFPDLNLDYLFGVLLINRDTKQEEFFAFLAEKPEDEERIWNQFLAFVNLYPNAPIFHYSDYEVKTIQRLVSLYHTPKEQLDSLLSRLIDVHKLAIESVILPVENYSLKTLANWLGFQWRIGKINGSQSVCWYDVWLKTGNRDCLAAILEYNEDDCHATRHLKDWLVMALENQLLTIDY